MNTFRKTVVASTLLLALSPLAQAAEKSPVSGNIALTSNYVWRGVSQSAEEPAIQGGFDYAHASGFYLGTWGSSVNFGNDAVTTTPNLGDGASLELDIYGGYKFTGAGINWDVGVLRYLYPGAAGSLKYDFTEVYLGAGYGPFSLKYSYTDDYTGDLANTNRESAHYIDAAANFELPEGVTLGLHVGRSDGNYFDESKQSGSTAIQPYTDYKVSLSKEFGGIVFNLSYTDTNLSGDRLVKKGVSANDGQWMLTLSKSL